MTQEEFNQYLILAIAQGLPGGHYISKWSGEEIDALLGGRSLVISGVYASLAALQAAFPNGADGAYQISSTKDLYVWNAKTKKWENIGPMQGPAGQKGTTFRPSVSADGTLSWVNDGGEPNPTPVNIAGVGIESIKKTAGSGAPGTYDIYTITLTDGRTTTFSVYNGAGAAADVPKVLKAAADAVAARDRAEKAKDQAESAADVAAASAAAARQDAAVAGSGAQLSQSWATGGTGTRPGEDTDNARYWADKAQAYAEQTNTPAVVQGVYNYILTDRSDGARYALLVEDGVLKLLGVSESLEATDLSLIDTVTGKGQQLVVEDGTLKLEEVS